MFLKILVPIAPDHPKTSDEALSHAKKLAKEGGKIIALTVMEPIPAYASHYMGNGKLEENHKAIMEGLRDDLQEIGDIEARYVSGHPSRRIVDFAKNEEVDCIVLASHRPGLKDYFIGSTAARVVRHAECSVIVLR